MLPCLAFPHPSPFRLLVPESEDRPYLAQLDLPRICPEETIGNNVASAAAVGMDGDQLGIPSLSLYLFSFPSLLTVRDPKHPEEMSPTLFHSEYMFKNKLHFVKISFASSTFDIITKV